ncbi:hypothetical protein HHI36_018654 [Cryptolaemus montrouzieri]|uniref:Uncharacterized protein n=1 Tax=Cryptolaemus montrouzieri TaxID=559131 RepID=A0ABD2P0N2_9CUCU
MELEICKDKLKEVESFFNEPPSFSGYRKIRSKLAHLFNRVGLIKPEENEKEQLDLESEALTKTLALLTRLDNVRHTSPCPPEFIKGQNLNTTSNTSSANPLVNGNNPTLNATTAYVTIPNSPVALSQAT